MAEPHVWRPTGLHWGVGAPVIGWLPPARAAQEVSRPVVMGAEMSFVVGEDRRCVGLRRSARRLPCPAGAAELPPSTVGGQCPACATMARSSSIATDTRPDDPRPFRLYLAAFDAGTVKVGITAVERGPARLLEQGALASLNLAAGRLMAARRAENVLTTVLGVPDRVHTAAKRRSRAHPGSPQQRATALADAARRARALTGWDDGLNAAPEAVPEDHTPLYGLPPNGLAPAATVGPLTPGAVLAGRVAAVVGTDLYLRAETQLVLLDTRLLAGWKLRPAPPDARFTAPLITPIRPETDPQPDALF